MGDCTKAPRSRKRELRGGRVGHARDPSRTWGPGGPSEATLAGRDSSGIYLVRDILIRSFFFWTGVAMTVRSPCAIGRLGRLAGWLAAAAWCLAGCDRSRRIDPGESSAPASGRDADAAMDTSVRLSEDARKYIWDVEHRAFQISHKAVPQFTKALSQK